MTSTQVVYNLATALDKEAICQLHIESWRLHYRGMLSDRYLDERIFQERRKVWDDRFENPDPSRIIITAKNNGQLVGFSCFFLDSDEYWGTLLDNLHVHRSMQGTGVGAALTSKTLDQIRILRPTQKMFLWVLVQNEKAIAFYQKLNGLLQETSRWDAPDGQKVECHRFVWSHIDQQ